MDPRVPGSGVSLRFEDDGASPESLSLSLLLAASLIVWRSEFAAFDSNRSIPLEVEVEAAVGGGVGVGVGAAEEVDADEGEGDGREEPVAVTTGAASVEEDDDEAALVG